MIVATLDTTLDDVPYHVKVHDFAFCTLWKDKTYEPRGQRQWTAAEKELADKALAEAQERRDEMPTAGLIQLKLKTP
jgi:hypothetical protein